MYAIKQLAAGVSCGSQRQTVHRNGSKKVVGTSVSEATLPAPQLFLICNRWFLGFHKGTALVPCESVLTLDCFESADPGVDEVRR